MSVFQTVLSKNPYIGKNGAQKDTEDIEKYFFAMEKALTMQPDKVLTKRLTATTQAVSDAVLPILNQVLGTFRELSDAVGKIPGLGKMIG